MSEQVLTITNEYNKSQLIRNWIGWLFALVTVSLDYSHVKV